ncbi:MAG: cytochrome c oxidase assembly protein [Actinomycetota bacterium]|nr:cytochrome c oxidase assembly protein [Actinomycetota bacterium]
MVIVVAAGLYLAGVVRAGRGGIHWPIRFTLAFTMLGLGSFAVVEFGFLGAYSHDLRWAFTTRIALLLFVIPACISAGRPIGLLRASLGESAAARLEWMLRTRLLRLFGNAIFATLFSAAVFCLFLTPLAWVLRGTPALSAGMGVVIPILGLIMVLPIVENAGGRTSLFITVEFLLAFVELVIDAVPGIILRLNDTILDHGPVIGPAIASAASWWPNPVHDQHLAGDALWFIAEIADVPILVLLFVRWSRSEKREEKKYDDLTDEQLDELTRQHLANPRG